MIEHKCKIAVQFYQAHNLGDDLFLIHLLERYPDNLFYVYADASYRYLNEKYKNMVLVESGSGDDEIPILTQVVAKIKGYSLNRDYRELLSLVRSSDALVVIGGSMFQQIGDPKAQEKSFFTTTQLYKHARHTFVIGANFGPYTDSAFLNTYRSIFGKFCDDVCFRDKRSADMFLDISTVRKATDVLFGIQLPKKAKRKNVFFSVCDLNMSARPDTLRAQSDHYIQWLQERIRECSARGYGVTISSFCEAEGDEKVVQQLMDFADKEKITVRPLFYRGDVDEILSELSSSELVVGTRFHSIVLGLVSGAKVLPVIYNVKTQNLLEDLNIDTTKCLNLVRGVGWNNVLSDMQSGNTSGLPELSSVQFSALDRFLRL